MSTTDTPPEAPEGPRVTRDEARDLGRLVRTSSASPENRYVAGVAGGIARHLDIDPVVVRIAFVVTVFFGGAGVLIYGAGWLFMPDERDGRAVVTLDARSRALAMWIALGIAALALIGDVAGGFDFPWWIIPTLIIILVFTRIWGRRDLAAEDRGETEVAVVEALEKAHQQTQASIDQALASADQRTAAALAKSQARTDAALAKARLRAERAQLRRTTRRGPLLFWFTLALIALAEGVLGVIDGAGADVVASAYPALALGIVGLMLALGAFWGRAGGLILVGLLIAPVLAATTVATAWDDQDRRVTYTPLSASAVLDTYEMKVGETVLDLRQVTDLDGLDGRRIGLEGDVGRIEVIVPAGVAVRANAHIDGFGHTEVLGHDGGGVDITSTAGQHLGSDLPSIIIDAELNVGEITIESEQ